MPIILFVWFKFNVKLGLTNHSFWLVKELAYNKGHFDAMCEHSNGYIKSYQIFVKTRANLKSHT